MRGRKETLFIPYRTTNTVIEYEPDRRIAWQTTCTGRSASVAASGATNLSPPRRPAARWCAKPGTCPQDKQKWMITSGSIPKQTADGMRATLERIAQLLES